MEYNITQIQMFYEYIFVNTERTILICSDQKDKRKEKRIVSADFSQNRDCGLKSECCFINGMEEIPDEIVIHVLHFIEHSFWNNILLTCKRFLELGREVFDPSINGNGAILWACQNNKIECVKGKKRNFRK